MSTQSESIGNLRELNGIDIDKGSETVKAIKKSPELANFKFRSENEWLSGFHNRTVIKPFYGAGKEYAGGDRYSMEADAPLGLLGTDQAADPVEYVLHALTACMTSTLVFHSAFKGTSISKISSTMEGDIDFHGFLALKDVKKGFSEIRVTFDVETEASEDILRELLSFSPVYEMISASVPVKVTFNLTKPMLS